MSPKIFIRALWLLSTLTCALALTACQPDRWPYSDSAEFQGVRVTISTPHRRYEVGEEVVIHAQWQNITNTTVILSGGDEPAFDIHYAVADTKFLWSQEHPDLALTHIELQPGQSVDAEVKLTGLANGGYLFYGIWRVWEGVAEPSATISIIVGPYNGN